MAMPKLADKTLTVMTVEKLKPRDERYDVYDAALRGFGVRVATSGTKTWFVDQGRIIVGAAPDFRGAAGATA